MCGCESSDITEGLLLELRDYTHQTKEMIKESLKTHGEAIILTDSGKLYEIHLGDRIDFGEYFMTIHMPTKAVQLSYDKIESVTLHYANEEG